MRISPNRMPDARKDLYDWLLKNGRDMYVDLLEERAAQHGGTILQPRLHHVPREAQTLVGPKLADKLITMESRNLKLASMYYVSDEFSTLALHAGDQLPDYNFHAEDVPSDFGFLVWGHPIGWADPQAWGELGRSAGNPDDEPIIAMTWGRSADAIKGDPAMWVTLWTMEGARVQATEQEIEERAREEYKNYCAETGRPYTKTAAKKFGEHKRAGFHATRCKAGLVLERNFLLPFMEEMSWDLPNSDAEASLRQLSTLNPTLADPRITPLVKTIIATFMLLNQKITLTERIEPDRAQSRRLAKTPTPASPVKLVTLRRPTRLSDGDEAPGVSESGREYTCQWVVSGHWRRYRVGPGRVRIEKKWISDYIAGPEDQPLVVKPTVKVLRR